MAYRSNIWNRAALVLGWIGLAVVLVLTPLGVRAVRASDLPDRSSEVCPLPSEAAPPAARVPGADLANRVGNPEPVDEDEFVPLNTQGYNYRAETAPAR